MPATAYGGGVTGGAVLLLAVPFVLGGGVTGAVLLPSVVPFVLGGGPTGAVLLVPPSGLVPLAAATAAAAAGVAAPAQRRWQVVETRGESWEACSQAGALVGFCEH